MLAERSLAPMKPASRPQYWLDGYSRKSEKGQRLRQPEGLIRVLLDSHGHQDERWDAAGDPEGYPTPEAVTALASVATSAEFAEADETLAEIAAASLATIWAHLERWATRAVTP